MPPSQLKQLKASINDRRNAKSSRQNGRQPSKPSPSKPPDNKQQAHIKKRPKSQGELTRRLTLLPELQKRHKVGGIVDRRIGENDPTMAPEERALQRYTRQRSDRNSIFNLEDDEDDAELTHLGRSLFENSNGHAHDDFDEQEFIRDSDDGEDRDWMRPATKRRRLSDEGDHQDGQPDAKKSKKEVMEEVIAKSKMYKFERQKTRDEDEDIRESLNKELPDLLTALKAGPRASSSQNLPNGHSSGQEESNLTKAETAEKDYDKSIRQLAQDQRAKPVDRTKTEEEKAEEAATRLQELERERLRRMKGEESDSEGDNSNENDSQSADVDSYPNNSATQPRELDVEDEDDFIIDKDLVASGSEIDSDADQEYDDREDQESNSSRSYNDDDDLDFLRDVIPSANNAKSTSEAINAMNSTSLPFTYECPEDHSQFLRVIKDAAISDVPLIIQRIRALYHPQLKPQNHEKMAKFAVALVDHLPFLASQKAPLDVTESVIRHIHSLSKRWPDATADAFRTHLSTMKGQSAITGGDLIILTAIGSIYPTSDHFHQIVTPAITIMARWLAMNSGRTTQESRIGAFLVALCIKYQQLSKRYIPETIRFTTSALNHEPKSVQSKFHVKNMMAMMELWSSKSAITEIFSPSALAAIEATGDSQALRKLNILLSQARLRRRPLELHHHRPLPIRMAIPRFEEGFDPNKHYDPDRERAEAQKLRKEHKREKKGALRELRKDASFIAREKLRAKKEADAAYEAKQRKLIAEIQGEEGREKNAYEREKRKRKEAR